MSERPEAHTLLNGDFVSAIVYERLRADNERLTAENERLREALVRHGKHTADCCDIYRGCVCGLDAALRREETT